MIISSYLAIPGRTYAFPAGPSISTITPEISNIYDNQTFADRFFVGSTAEYKPVEWFTHRRARARRERGRRRSTTRPIRARHQARFSLDIDNSKGFIAEGRPLAPTSRFSYDATLTKS